MNYLFIGKPGSGKTTAACLADFVKPPIGIIDADGKAEEMVNIQPLIASGDVVIQQVSAKLVEDSLVSRALNPDKGLKIQPAGYVEILTYLNQVLEDKLFQDCNTICLDSLSRVVEHLKRLLIFHRTGGKFGQFVPNKATDDMNWPSWGTYLANLEELFMAITSHLDKDFICTAHLKEMTEKATGSDEIIITGYWPMVDGAMREKLAGYFNEVYFMEKKEIKNKPTIYQFRTAGKKYCARTSKTMTEVEPIELRSAILQPPKQEVVVDA